MRRLFGFIAAVLLLVAGGCDFGMSADEVEAEEAALRGAGGVSTIFEPSSVVGDPTTPQVTVEETEGATGSIQEVVLRTRRGADEPAPAYFPGVGTPVRTPPGPCPPPKNP